jgi:steroid delta-isomerase-like uncharacterized protein
MIQTIAILPLLAVPAETLEQNKVVVRRIYEEVINAGKLELIPAIVSESYAGPGPQGDKGPAAYRAIVEALKGGFPDVKFTVEELIAERDRVVVRWSWTGTHTGTFRGIPASGKAVKDTGIAIYVFKDGKVLASILETDRLGVLQQIGLIPRDLNTLVARKR